MEPGPRGNVAVGTGAVPDGTVDSPGIAACRAAYVHGAIAPVEGGLTAAV